MAIRVPPKRRSGLHALPKWAARRTGQGVIGLYPMPKVFNARLAGSVEMFDRL